jgi:hypothetical protein
VIKKANGRSDILALRAHYGGFGNLTAIIAEAQRLYNTLSYRSEKSKDHLRNSCVCFILDKNRVQAASLHLTIDTLMVRY